MSVICRPSTRQGGIYTAITQPRVGVQLRGTSMSLKRHPGGFTLMLVTERRIRSKEKDFSRDLEIDGIQMRHREIKWRAGWPQSWEKRDFAPIHQFCIKHKRRQREEKQDLFGAYSLISLNKMFFCLLQRRSAAENGRCAHSAQQSWG